MEANNISRLGPLEVEQKKRAASKRTRFEKNKEDEKKPQEITEADITRSENETTKNVAAVSHSRWWKSLSLILWSVRCLARETVRATRWTSEPTEICHQPS